MPGVLAHVSPVADRAALRTGFFEEVRTILRPARRKAYAASNFIIVEANFMYVRSHGRRSATGALVPLRAGK
jgi:hypothetical protein